VSGQTLPNCMTTYGRRFEHVKTRSIHAQTANTETFAAKRLRFYIDSRCPYYPLPPVAKRQGRPRAPDQLASGTMVQWPGDRAVRERLTQLGSEMIA